MFGAVRGSVNWSNHEPSLSEIRNDGNRRAKFQDGIFWNSTPQIEQQRIDQGRTVRSRIINDAMPLKSWSEWVQNHMNDPVKNQAIEGEFEQQYFPYIKKELSLHWKQFSDDSLSYQFGDDTRTACPDRKNFTATERKNALTLLEKMPEIAKCVFYFEKLSYDFLQNRIADAGRTHPDIAKGLNQFLSFQFDGNSNFKNIVIGIASAYLTRVAQTDGVANRDSIAQFMELANFPDFKLPPLNEKDLKNGFDLAAKMNVFKDRAVNEQRGDVWMQCPASKNLQVRFKGVASTLLLLAQKGQAREDEIDTPDQSDRQVQCIVS